MARFLFPLMVLLLGPAVTCAQSVWHEGHEGPETSWRDARGDAGYRIDQHARVQEGAHSGRWCERLRVNGNNGTYVLVAHDVAPARVIAELGVGVWIKADRPGLQLLARVVLPRTVDPRTGKPAAALLRGSGYTQVGSWQQLRIDNIPQLVERQVRVLRASLGPQVDPREAVVDQVVLNAYGGPGATLVWIDDLEMTGLVGRAVAPSPDGYAARPRRPELVEPERLPSTWRAPGAAAVTPLARPEVVFDGAVLTVGGRPLFPRMIEHQGESLLRLQTLGFNTVRFASTPTVDMLDEAARLGLWIIAPPPALGELQGGLNNPPGAKLGPELDGVLAWDLGQNLSGRELDDSRAWAKALRAVDARGRPIIVSADAELRAYSRHADILSVRRSPLFGSLELTDYARWLTERPHLARPGTPLWTTIQTQPSARLLEQISVAASAPRVVEVQEEQLRTLVFAALTSGVRGLAFDSSSSLDETDPVSRRRAAMLERLNLELDLIEPWAAGGSFVTTAESSNPQLIGAVLQTERARLLLPLVVAEKSQYAAPGQASGVTSFVVPGVPESNDAYELTPGGLRPLFHKRVTGGIRVAFGDGDGASPVLFTQDPAVVNSLMRRTAKVRRRAMELDRELATQSLATTETVERALIAVGQPPAKGTASLAAARLTLAQCDASAARDEATAIRHARRTLSTIRQVERFHWESAWKVAGSPVSNPLACSFASLPDFWRTQAQVSNLSSLPNQLVAGDFENLQGMVGAGWRHFQHQHPGVETHVELTPDSPHGGQFALRLTISPGDPKQPAGWIESPPLWVTSAPIPVQAGQLIRIHGWAQITKPITGSVDGLMILDTFGGEELAERIASTSGWREFTLLRAAPRSDNFVITFAQTGQGEARLDDVTVQILATGSAPPLEQASTDRAMLR